jgi:pimeloyl-ACP methyl ester carboxylesterase
MFKLDTQLCKVSDTTKLNFVLLSADSPQTILLLNGFSRPLTDFRSLASSLVGAGHSVLLVDVRGSGDTEWSGEFGLDDIASDLGKLCQHLQIEKIHLAGISMGGVIAQAFTLKNPEVVSSLSLVSTTPSQRFVVGPQAWPEGPDEFIESVGRYFAPEFAQKNKLLIKGFAKSIRLKIEQDAKRYASSIGQSGSSLQRKMLATTELLGQIEGIAAPTQIIHGREDQIISPESAEAMHSKISGSKLYLDSGVGHLYLAENISLLQDRISLFVKEV